MKISIDIELPLFKWQMKHHQKMTYAELARRANITILALSRLRSGKQKHPDLRKIAKICEELECQPGDIFVMTED